MEHHIILYGKPQCHLCDLTHQLLLGLRREFEFTLEKVDISGDPALFKQYRDKIPVVVIDGQTFVAPIHLMQLRAALKQPLPGEGQS